MTHAEDENTPLTDSGKPAAIATATSPHTPPPDRKYLLERVDDAAVAQLYADGFSSLPLDQKILIWHLYQAALAGRDIYYDQRYAHNLEMREVLRAVAARFTLVPEREEGERMRRRSVTLAPARGASIIPLTR